ncbi:MAG: hypothetical protein AB2385_00020 [Symbiobacterium sp.]|uniref:hypothetical protein n=1 Tax=Symbiobacterium sp. TaxID=1971213 RepID=UPI0034642D9B
MRRLERAALLATLAEKLIKHGSWCGETHLQKATYFLQEMFGVSLGYEFVLYKHGPFSFELRDELTSLRADGVLELRPRPYPYGPSLYPSESGRKLAARFANLTEQYDREISLVATYFGDKGVAELERLATALYVRKMDPSLSQEQRAKRICALKPHVHFGAAYEAVRSVDELYENLQS